MERFELLETGITNCILLHMIDVECSWMRQLVWKDGSTSRPDNLWLLISTGDGDWGRREATPVG